MIMFLLGFGVRMAASVVFFLIMTWLWRQSVKMEAEQIALIMLQAHMAQEWRERQRERAASNIPKVEDL